MTNREYEILSYIQDTKDPGWIDAINAFDPSNHATETKAILKVFLSAGMIEMTNRIDKPPLCRIRLTNNGVVALLAETERRALSSAQEPADSKQSAVDQEQTNNNKDNNWIPRCLKIIGLITALLGLAGAILDLLQ